MTTAIPAAGLYIFLPLDNQTMSTVEIDLNANAQVTKSERLQAYCSKVVFAEG